MKPDSKFISLFFLAVSGNTFAAETVTLTPGAGLLQISLALLFVLGLMFLVAWAFKRINPAISGNKIPMKVLAGLNLGNRERVMVIEVGDQWLVLGVTASNITNLATLPKQDSLLQAIPTNSNSFQGWLQRTIEKRGNTPTDANT
ncbi:flagellar biosynthetic protein FliO [Undibacterium sp. WLHG33]|uniref:flagellar biosynthetic protein FliO n=1 Tax=Undibacterium sp. WLHG33 TaxID=3412482 RepID=UPI003C305494